MWESSSQNKISLLDLLNSPNCSIESILDFDDIVNTFRSDTPELQKYFNNEKVSQLIKYTTEMPKETEDSKAQYKYPYIASEILSSDNKEMCELFFVPPPDSPNESPKLEDSDLVTSHVDSPQIKDKVKNGSDASKSPFHNNKTSLIQNNFESKIEYDKSNEYQTNPIHDNLNKYSISFLNKENENQELPNLNNLNNFQLEGSSNTNNINLLFPQNICKSIIASEDCNSPSQYKDLKEQLMNFLKTDEELDSLLAGYFEKTISSLLSKTYEKIMKFIFNSEYLERFIFHCYETSISVILYKLISLDNSNYGTPEKSNDPEFEEYRKKLITILIRELLLAKNPLKAKSIAKILIKAIDAKVLTPFFYSPQTIDEIFKIFDLNEYSTQSEGILIIIAILKLLNNQTPNEATASYIINKSIQYIKSFKDKIFQMNLDNTNVLDHPSGVKSYKCGIVTMIHLDWIYQLQLTNPEIINEKNGECGYANYFLFLIPQYELNTILLNKICVSYITCLKSVNRKVLDYFIIQCNIGKTLKLLISNKYLEISKPCNKSTNKPFTVFVIKIANMVLHCSSDDFVKAYLEKSKEWNDLISNDLTKINEFYSKPIAGGADKFTNPTISIRVVENENKDGKQEEKKSFKLSADLSKNLNAPKENFLNSIKNKKKAFQKKYKQTELQEMVDQNKSEAQENEFSKDPNSEEKEDLSNSNESKINDGECKNNS